MKQRSLQILQYIAKWFSGTKLSTRERQVFAGYFIVGWNNKRIGHAMGIEADTIRSIKSKLAHKLAEDPTILERCVLEWPLGRSQEDVVADFVDRAYPVDGMTDLRETLIRA